MELNTNSTVNLPHDGINIIFEFAQTESEETGVNRDGIISEGTGDKVVHLVHDSLGSHGGPVVPAQRTSTNDLNCLIGSVATQKTLQSDDDETKHCRTEQKTSMSQSNVPQLSISNPHQPWISNSLQPSISSPPPMPTMRIGNKQVVQRVYVQMPVQTQVFQKQKTSESRPASVKEKCNNKKLEDSRITKVQAKGAQITDKQIDGTPITNSTKLALLNFLKKKSFATVVERNGESCESNIDPEIQIISPVGEEISACKKDKTCSDQLRNIHEAPANIPARTEDRESLETAPTSESCSSEPNPSSQVSTQSCNESMPTAVESNDTYHPSNQESDATEVDDKITDKERKQADKNCSVSLCTKGKTLPVQVAKLRALLNLLIVDHFTLR